MYRRDGTRLRSIILLYGSINAISLRINDNFILIQFIVLPITVPYNKEVRLYDVHHQPLWDWALGLVDHPRLIHEFTWDAEKISKWTGGRWECFIHEPWTANDWWELQSDLPSKAQPICFILYADKTRLSSFGTAKAYPVVARSANLPVHIRNGNRIGGGEVVGWLPIVSSSYLPNPSINLKFLLRLDQRRSFRIWQEEIYCT